MMEGGRSELVSLGKSQPPWLASDRAGICRLSETCSPCSVWSDPVFLYWGPLLLFVFKLKNKEVMWPKKNGRPILQGVLSCFETEYSDFRFLISSWYTPDFRCFSNAFRRTLKCFTEMTRQNIIINYGSACIADRFLLCHCCGVRLVWKWRCGLVLLLKTASSLDLF